jgi:hypothetical protein
MSSAWMEESGMIIIMEVLRFQGRVRVVCQGLDGLLFHRHEPAVFSLWVEYYNVDRSV